MSVVIALDVDGVLNVYGAPGYTAQHDVYLPAEILPKHEWIRGFGHEDLRTRVHLNPTHGPMITRWRDQGADVRWCTTWGDAANVALCPLLGIDPLPVIPVWDVPDSMGSARAVDSGKWKLNGLLALFPTGPLVWIDDQALPSWGHVRSDPTLIIEVNFGLTAADKSRVTRFLRRHA
jgi:hypothetical protein